MMPKPGSWQVLWSFRFAMKSKFVTDLFRR